MRLGFAISSLVLWAALSGAALAETRFVQRLEAPIRAQPTGSGMEVARLQLGAKVEAGERKKSWRSVTVDGKTGWMHRSQLGTAAPSDRAVCRQGKQALARQNMTAALTFLRFAFDRGTKNRGCLEALATAYRVRGMKADEDLVRAKIRLLENWMAGAWCDVSQRLVLKLGDDGRFDFRAGDQAFGAGKYDLRTDELHLGDDRGRANDLVFFVKKRGSGRILVSLSADELQRDFCVTAPQ